MIQVSVGISKLFKFSCKSNFCFKSYCTSVSSLHHGIHKQTMVRNLVNMNSKFSMHSLTPDNRIRKNKRRVARGYGGKGGGTGGRGTRGQNSRSGGGCRPGFEGGQLPLYRRLPKLKGIAGGMSAGLPNFVTINIDEL